jgi:hypothetical protein
MQVDAIAADRRQHPRTLSHTEATVSTRRGIFHYTVSNLSVAGALLVDGPPLMEGDHIEITLRLPLYPEFRVPARVVHVRGDRDDVALGIAFEHADDRTEDHIQSALLSEIERSQTEGRIADVLA